MIIKKLPQSKWKTYKELRLESLKLHPTAFGSPYSEELKFKEVEWKRRMNNTYFAILDEPIGMIAVVPNTEARTRHIANIYSFYVKPEYRKQRIGKKLLEHAISVCKKNKFVKIKICANTKNKVAYNLYKKVGFRDIGILNKELYVNNKFYDEILMEKLL